MASKQTEANNRWREKNPEKWSQIAQAASKRRNDRSREHAVKGGARWSILDTEQLRLLAEEGVPDREIAKILRRSIASVSCKRRSIGVSHRHMSKGAS